jgi:hypothetical protein
LQREERHDENREQSSDEIFFSPLLSVYTDKTTDTTVQWLGRVTRVTRVTIAIGRKGLCGRER